MSRERIALAVLMGLFVLATVLL
ncbi:hypothetical protein LCGC14_3110640, partial [marine sediment metagenome]